MKARKLALVLTAVTLLSAMAAPAALGSPSEEGFKANDAWLCEDDGFVENHCLSVNSIGNTLNIKVFDDRGPQESASADPEADSRPSQGDPICSGYGNYAMSHTATISATAASSARGRSIALGSSLLSRRRHGVARLPRLPHPVTRAPADSPSKQPGTRREKGWHSCEHGRPSPTHTGRLPDCEGQPFPRPLILDGRR